MALGTGIKQWTMLMERKFSFEVKSKGDSACWSANMAALRISEVKLNDKEYKIFNADDIIAIIE